VNGYDWRDNRAVEVNQAALSSPNGTCCMTGAVLKSIMILKYMHGKMQDPAQMRWATESLEDVKFKESCAPIAIPVTKYLP